MPELPEVETIKNILQKDVGYAKIFDVQINNWQLRQPVSPNLFESVHNQKICEYKRLAKYILIFLSNNNVLVFHLGMSGTIRIEKEKRLPQKHDHLVFRTSSGYMIYNDPRRFGLCVCLSADSLVNHPLFINLGIDPFDVSLKKEWLKKQFFGRSIEIKQALLNQKIISGIGNIYASEALFWAGILPTRKANSLTLRECDALIKGIRKTLSQAIDAGGSTLKDYRKPDGSLGYFQNSHCVYGKTGQSCFECVCHLEQTGGIKKITQGGRSTYYCATKQR